MTDASAAPSSPRRRRALLSVSDKEGIEILARGLVERGWELLSTGGTARRLREADLPVTEVSEVTGHPEMMDGRVKTLHPAIHAGILARRERRDDLEALQARGYRPIDMVVVNLYAFRETVAAGASLPEAMEKVDIGGPTLLRAAAKSHADVWVVVDPTDYGRVLQALGAEGEADRLRRELATKVFRHVSGYDAAIADYLEGRSPADREMRDAAAEAGVAAEAHADSGSEVLPGELALRLERVDVLRYGENPDQEAAFYRSAGTRHGLAALEQHHGKALSYNNLLDLDGALLCLSPFALSRRPACVIIKHTTPAGLAVGETLEEAYRAALATDPMSSFGSVIAVNRPLDEDTARAMSELFVECIVAPSFGDRAFDILTAKKNLRLLTFPGPEGPFDGHDRGLSWLEEVAGGASGAPGTPPRDAVGSWWQGFGRAERAALQFLALHGRVPEGRGLRTVYGGALAQTPPVPPFYGVGGPVGRVVTERGPTEAEWDDLAFAWAAVFGVKSNAILLASGGRTLGIGAGQMSRVDASRIAVRKAADAELDLEGAVLASDAFFPFRDGVEAAARAGVRAIVQPGGSIRDDEVIAAADEHGMAMVFTGRRLFRH